jgi:hypothetical protein
MLMDTVVMFRCFLCDSTGFIIQGACKKKTENTPRKRFDCFCSVIITKLENHTGPVKVHIETFKSFAFCITINEIQIWSPWLWRHCGTVPRAVGAHGCGGSH